MYNTLLCVLALLYKSSSSELKPILTVSPSWLSPGAPVTLSCNVGLAFEERRFYWYKAVPDLPKKNYRYELLPDSTSGTQDDSYTFHKQTKTAGYACRAETGNPQYFTDYSETKFVWSAVFRPAASLRVSPSMVKHYTDHNVSLNCEGTSAEWRVRKYKEINNQSYLSDCSTLRTTTGSSCTIKSQSKYDAVYWCESGSGEFSNAVNITVYKPKPVLTVFPPWQSSQASVTLNCQIEDLSVKWRFYWYKVIPDFSYKIYIYKLLPDSIYGTVENSFIIHGQRHTAGYACRAKKGHTLSEYFADYSEPKFIWSADSHPAASLTVSPDREQHFTSESVTLNCKGNSTHWRVKKFTEEGDLIELMNCREMIGYLCTINYLRSQKAIYWCESGSGEFSSAVNISLYDGDLVLVNPVRPVNEGASVSLSCRLRGQSTLSSANFYHNDKLVQNDGRGELNISAVSQSVEGFYKCGHSGKVSPLSWMAVRLAASRPENPSFPMPLVVGPLGGKILIILLLLLGHVRDLKGP